MLASRQISLDRFWQVLRPEFLFLTWVLMEVTLLAPVTLAIMPWARFWPPFAFALWLGLVMLIPFNLSRLLSLRQVSLFKQQNLLLLAFFMTLVISFRGLLYTGTGWLGWIRELGVHFAQANNPFLIRDLLLFFLIALLWWRGTALTSRRVDINELGLRVRLGALIMAPTIIFLARLRLTWSVMPFIMLFFFASLLAIALTRAEQLEQEHSGQNYPMSPRWLGMVFATSLAVVLLATLAALAASGDFVPQLLEELAPVRDALLFGGTTVVVTLTYLFLPVLALFERFAFFVNRLLGREFVADTPPPPDNAQQTAEQFEALIRWLTRPTTTFSFVINRALLILLIVLVFIFVLLLVERYFSRRRLARQAEEERWRQQSREVELEPEGLGQRLLRRLGLLSYLRAASVRRLYGEMCRAAAELGYPRTIAETPYEYRETLLQVWPEGVDDISQLTNAYVRVRYGEVPETRAEIQMLKDAWRRLQRLKATGPEPRSR